MHFKLIAHARARWSAQQIAEALTLDEAPRLLIRDRDALYGVDSRWGINRMGIEEVVTGHRSPAHNPFSEGPVGSIRRGSTSQPIVLNEDHVFRILRDGIKYYPEDRTQISLDRNATIPPIEKAAATSPPTCMSRRRSVRPQD